MPAHNLLCSWVRPLSEKPVFDVANDVTSDFAIPTTIPAEKAAARDWLAAKVSGSGVTVKVLKPKAAPKPRAWKPSKRPANTNREIRHWPLIEKLHRDGRGEDAELVEQYHGLVALMALEPLQGQDPSFQGDGLNIEHRSSIKEDDVDDAAAAGWKSEKVAGGNIVYKGERQLTKAPGTASQARQTDDKTVVVMRDMGLRFNERNLIAQIDMRGVLPRLRQAMGPLVPAFERAALGGATFRGIGEDHHFKGKQAEAVGKALVMIALNALRNEWADIRREARAAEEQAERNVERRRRELAAERARFLGRAA